MMRFTLVLIIVSLGNQLDAQLHDRYWITGYNVWEPNNDFGSSYYESSGHPGHIDATRRDGRVESGKRIKVKM